MPGRDLALVVRREISTRVRQRSFVVSTLISGALILGVLAVSGAFERSDDRRFSTYDLGVVSSPSSDELIDALSAASAAHDDEVHVVVRPLADPQDAERLLESFEVDAAVVGEEVLVNSRLPADLRGVLVAASEGLDDFRRLRVRALHPVSDAPRQLGPLAGFALLLVWSQVAIGGRVVADGVVEEKTSAVVEVLLLKLRPGTLLLGKIVGLGLLGLGQTLFLVAIGALGLTGARVPYLSFFQSSQNSGDLALDTLDLSTGFLVTNTLHTLLWFVVGWVVYCCAFAGAAAMISRPEQLQWATGPVGLVGLASLWVGLIAAIAPERTLATWTSFVPPAAPLVVPMRVAAGAMPGWQVAASLVWSIVVAAVVVLVAGRLYRRAPLP